MVHAYSGGRHHWMFGPTPCLTALPRTPSGSWRTNPLSAWHSRKNWVRKQPHRHLSQILWDWVGVSYSLTCTSLWKNWTASWTVNNHIESNGWGTIRHWHLHIAKTTWLVNTWGYTSQAGPSQSKPPHSVEWDMVSMRDRLWGIY